MNEDDKARLAKALRGAYQKGYKHGLKDGTESAIDTIEGTALIMEAHSGNPDVIEALRAIAAGMRTNVEELL